MSVGSASSSSSVSCGLGDVSVQLRRFLQRDYPLNNGTGYRLRVVAHNPCGMSKELFRYVQLPADVLTGTVRGDFSGVCTWPDLESLPIGAPDPSLDPPTFRLDYMDIVVKNGALADDVWDIIQEHVQALTTAISRGQVLEDTGSVTIQSEDT